MEFRDSSGGVARASECYPSTAAINLGEIANTVARINVYSNSTLVNIPSVALDMRTDRPSSSILDVFVTEENVLTRQQQIFNAGGINFAGLNLNANDEHRVRFAGYITGNLTGNVRVGQVRRLQVDGAIQSEVFGGFAYAPDGFSVGTIQAGSIASTAAVLAGNDASLVRVFGNIDGAVEVLSGSINDLIVNGDIPGTVQATKNILRSSISGNVSGSIIAQGGVTAPFAEQAIFGQVDGVVRLGPVLQSSESGAVVVMSADSTGRIEVYSMQGNALLQSLTGGANSGFYVETDFAGIIQALGETIDRIEVAGDLLTGVSSTGPKVLGMHSLGELVVGGNLSSACQSLGRFIQVDEIGRISVGGDLEASITNESRNGACFVPEIFVGGDLQSPLLVAVNGRDIWLAGVQSMNVNGSVDLSPCKTALPDIYLDSLEATARVDIGGRFRGRLFVGDLDSGLPQFAGQIVVNGRLCESSAQDAWPSQSEFWVLPSQAPVSVMPFYQPTTSDLGGGYLAVAPYGLYESMCTPVDNSTGTDRITASSFYRGQNDNCTNNDPIKLHFYGPIQIWNPFVPAAKVELITTNGTIDVSRLVTYRINPANPRELLIEGKLDAALPPGQYRVTNSTTANQALYLIPVAGTGTPCTPAVAVSPFQYNFQLLPDCAPPYCEAETNPSQECVALPNVLCDPIDFNNDGSSFDPQDIDAFLSVFSEGPCIPSTATCNDIDFNNDGVFFDPCDTDAFNLMFQEGPCTACGQ